MPFDSPDVYAYIREDGTYVLTQPLTYHGRDETFTVPAAFDTDLASVPSFLTWLVPIAGVGDRAAILHDWLCVHLDDYWHDLHNPHCSEPAPDGPPPANSRDTDGIFRRCLRELGVPTVRRWLYWTGVRWGALANPARRAGWAKDAPLVAAISLCALPVVLLASIGVGIGLVVYGAAEAVAGIVAKMRGKK